MDERAPLDFLSQEQVQDLGVLAEKGRQVLSRFAGREISFCEEGVHLLDEWIEDQLEAGRDPPLYERLVWTSLLGEMLRRAHGGRWAARGDKLVMVCPTDGEDQWVAPVREQIDRRIESGMSESLSYFYNVTRVQLKLG